jgi:hypothetical protein
MGPHYTIEEELGQRPDEARSRGGVEHERCRLLAVVCRRLEEQVLSPNSRHLGLRLARRSSIQDLSHRSAFQGDSVHMQRTDAIVRALGGLGAALLA